MSLPRILPGASIGILGSGQLGRMLAIAARQLGYGVQVYSPEADPPAGAVADRTWVAAYDDRAQVQAFARAQEVVTYEFENVPASTAEAVAQHTLLRPAGAVLRTSQHRLREKTFLRERNVPVADFVEIPDLTSFYDVRARVFPAVLKTAGFGYDGKGQVVIDAGWDDARAAAVERLLATGPCILERFIDFALEVSVVAARGVDGAFAAFPVFENHHRNHILDVTVAPARIDPAIATEAVRLTRAVLEALDVVGVLCVEFFVTREGALLVNELAPRVHNSGHLTIEAANCSQFEQQIRAVCGLPLGDPSLRQPAAMANLLGDLWAQGTPRWERALATSGVHLHLYGKREARPGRKMGHLTALAATVEEAEARVLAARASLLG